MAKKFVISSNTKKEACRYCPNPCPNYTTSKKPKFTPTKEFIITGEPNIPHSDYYLYCLNRDVIEDLNRKFSTSRTIESTI